MTITPQVQREISRAACILHRKHGIPRKQACMMAARAVLRVLERPPGGGMGVTTALKDASELEPVKAVREAVSPWLWIFSIISFGMAMLNTKRIARMYKGRMAVRRR